MRTVALKWSTQEVSARWCRWRSTRPAGSLKYRRKTCLFASQGTMCTITLARKQKCTKLTNIQWRFFFWRLGINSIVNFCYYITIKTLFQISSFSFKLLTSTLVITIFIDILIYYLISWLVKTALKAYLSSRSIFENFLINIINSSYTIQITVM